MKRLILVLALAFVLGITSAALAEVQNVKVSGDITILGASRDNLSFTSKSAGGNVDAAAWASISRIKVDANLTDNVNATVRLLNERVWGTADATTPSTAQSSSAVNVDLAYVTLKDFLKDDIGFPLTVVAGRQDIKIGSGLLVGSPGGNQTNLITNLPAGLKDVSAQKAFDAIVGVADFAPLMITAGFVKVSEAAITVNKDDINAIVLNAAYDLGNDNMSTVAEFTYLLQRASNKASVNNFGGRVTSMPVENLGVAAEYVYQTARKSAAGTLFTTDGKDKDSDALLLSASYALPEVEWTPTVGVDYARLSKRWNPMHESLVPADLMNLIFPNSAATVIGASVAAKPKEDLMLKLRYASLDLAKKWTNDDGTTFTSSGTGQTYTMVDGKKQLGYELDAGLAYDYTEDVQLGLNYGYFKPGKAFDECNRKAASQVIGSMKVTF